MWLLFCIQIRTVWMIQSVNSLSFMYIDNRKIHDKPQRSACNIMKGNSRQRWHCEINKL